MSEVVKVARRQKIGGTGTIPWLSVYVSREAELDVRLSEIRTRRVTGINLVARDGYDDALTYHLTYEDAIKLHGLLNEAIEEVRDDLIDRPEEAS